MEKETFYRDVESAKSVSSQLRGRRSMLLDSLPDSFLAARDANTSVWSQKSWSSQHAQHHVSTRRAIGGARTAPSSPVRSWPRAVPPRRPFTPTPMKGKAEDTNTLPAAPVSDNCDSRNRWVSFSFASGVTSRQLSETHPMSLTPSPSPPPRAAIMPSAFPNLCFSDVAEESVGRSGDNEEERDFCASIGDRAAVFDTPTPSPPRRPMIAFHGDSPQVLFDEDPLSKGREKCRESILLVPSGTRSETTNGSDNSEGNIRMNPANQSGKRPRSPPPSPVNALGMTSSVVIGGDSVVLIAAEERHEGNKGESEKSEDIQSAIEPKRRRTEDRTVVSLTNEQKDGIEAEEMEKTSRVSQEENSVLVDASPSLLFHHTSKESLLLVNGSTPTPWRQLQSAAVVEMESGPMRNSEVIDTDPVALFTTNDPIAPHPGVTNAASLVLTASEDCPATPVELRPSAELVALIEAAKEELRRASERLLAATCAQRHSPLVPLSFDDASVRLSGGTPLDSEHNAYANGNVDSDDVDTGKRRWTPPVGDVLRSELVTYAGRILRRLRGYDDKDVDLLPGGLVARVVCQVLAGEDAHSTIECETPVRASKGLVDLSWCVLTPSPMPRGRADRSAATPARNTWELAMARQKAQAAEEMSMQLFVNLWHCFRERFGERHAAARLGMTIDTPEGGPSQWTSFPRLRQQLAQRAEKIDQPPLDTLMNYRVFANSLAELK